MEERQDDKGQYLFALLEDNGGEQIWWERRISSAYIVRLELGEKESLGRSLTYRINSKGPRMEPCGTPEETTALEERQEDTETC